MKELNVRRVMQAAVVVGLSLFTSSIAQASESDLKLPALDSVSFHGIPGRNLLMAGLGICFLGLLFGLYIYNNLRNLPVHKSMLEVSELIYATCKTYLRTQGKFIMILWVFIAAIIVAYFGFLQPASGEAGQVSTAWRVIIILAFSLIGIAGSYSVAAFGIRINTFANSRTALASLRGKPYPLHSIPLRAGMSIGMVLISVELLLMLMILLFVPRTLAGACFIGFAIGESLGAAALRVAGGIFTKIADIGADLMKIVFNVKEDDARNPGVIADCTGDNAGDSVGPTADGFETYGVTGVALITFILLAVPDPINQVKLLVWIFVMRLVMLLASGGSYIVNQLLVHAKYANADEMNFEHPLQMLVWLTSLVSIACTYVASYVLIPDIGDGSLWWKLASIISCGTLAGAVIPEVTTFFTSTKSRHVREVVTASREGGASLNILSGLTAGNFSAFWIGGVVIVSLMAVACWIATMGLSQLMIAESVFAFGLVAFGFLGMGPVTIAVDSYGPVTDNAQSVYELSLIETLPNIREELRRDFNCNVDFERAKHMLEENDGAGNTFKATAKPVLIGTAVVGATTMIFSIIVLLTHGLDPNLIGNLSILHAPFLLGLLAGGAVIYWFTGASCQAVITGAYRAVEYIKRNMKLDGAAKASMADSQKVVEICTRYAQAGMFNIFLTVFFITLAAAFVEPYFFVAFLISLAIFGLFQAIFMANAGGAWDNAKKIVEVELREKGTPLHSATVVGDTVGDPFKDTSSVALNPIIKFSTLFGLLAVQLAVSLDPDHTVMRLVLAGVFFAVALTFVYRSFYGMRIKSDSTADVAPPQQGKHKDDLVRANDLRSFSEDLVERDNVGTRYDTEEQVQSFWVPFTLNRPKFPFIFYDMREKKDAMDAMLSLPPIKVAADSGKLISTEVLQFGIYPHFKNGKIVSWGFFLAGNQITPALYNAAIASCKRYNGTDPRVSEPPKDSVTNVSNSSTPNFASVTFDWEEKVDMMEQATARGVTVVITDVAAALAMEKTPRIATKRHYNAPNKDVALAYLKANSVDKPFFYLVVHTPDGVFGRDKNGIFEEPA